MLKTYIVCDGCEEKILIDEESEQIPENWVDAGELGHLCQKCQDAVRKLSSFNKKCQHIWLWDEEKKESICQNCNTKGAHNEVK